MSGWSDLGSPKPPDLVDARLQLHHAALWAAAVGATLLEPRPDDGHPNLGWDAASGSLAGHAVAGPRPFRGALRLAEPALLVLEEDGRESASLPLDGRTLEEAGAWLARTLGERAPDGVRPPGYELPDHAIARGAAFAARPPEAFAELSRWYAATAASLERLAAATPGASPVRCWPHHFDLATLVTLEAGDDPESSRTVGLGLSPGDGSYAEPYLYVTPWPYPEAGSPLPPLPEGGHWHTEGFTAAILTGSSLVATSPGPAREAAVEGFLTAAFEASRRLTGAGS